MKMIAHMDMDAFFAAIEERDNPRWAGQPIVVGSEPAIGRGVVSTANYKAREYGIRSAMPIRTAYRLAPDAIFLPVNGRVYGQTSQAIMDIIAKHVPLVEQASIDEAYFDLSQYRTWSAAEIACRRVKKEIFKAQRLTCSIGLGANKLIAKIASDFNKPDGLTVVRPAQMPAFLAPLDIRKIPGIGPKSEQVLKRRGLDTVGDIQRMTEADLYQLFGEWGLDLYDMVRGKGSDELIFEWTAKSIGEQETFDADTLESDHIVQALERMCASVIRQFKKDRFTSYRCIVLTVRFADFKTAQKSHTLEKPAATVSALKTEMMKLLLPFFDRRQNPQKKLIRLVGVRIEKLQ